MICVFDVTAGPAKGRRFWIRSNQRMEIGRISTADFSVPTDPHMSRYHLVVEGELSNFRVRDVGSSNGTYVNDARVTTLELCSGDQIKAGVTTLRVSMLGDEENPHGEDGFAFSPRTVESNSVELPTRTIEDLTRELTDELATARCQSQGKSDSATDGEKGTVGGEGSLLDSVMEGICFELTEVPGLVTISDSDGENGPLLVKLVQRLEAHYAITAVVNVDRLGRFGKQLIGKLVEAGAVSWVDPTTCLVVNNRNAEFHRLAESALTLDALYLVGGEKTVDMHWLSAFAATVSDPSQLAQLSFAIGPGRDHAILENAEFALFERDENAGLCMVLRALMDGV